ncbi:hypothetical protein RUM43_008590 [Polyplax serrata]|uniref:WD repeat-containing protein 74 n=1 Tax=Polyplax serrata TaxID=468196 RepID=A0AAN8P9Y3_POLSC
MSKKTKATTDFNLYVGGKTGAFKGVKVDYNGIIVKNLQNVEILKPESEISFLSWNENKECDILIGTVNQTVKIYDIEFKAYSTSFEAKFGTGPIVGFARVNGAVTTCSGSGHIKVWKYKKNEQIQFSVGGEVSRMKEFYQKEGVIGLGGNKNDFKIWDIERKEKIFCAKNVKKDMLELEVPIWVTDLTFLPDSEYKVAVSTRHGQVRLYDTKAQRRPVIDINIENQSLNTITLCHNNNQVIVGSTTGHLMMADLRGKGKILHRYKGPVGSVRQVAAHPKLPYFASVGLDRYMRIHHTESRRLLFERYLKVRLNTVLMSSKFGKDLEKLDQSDDDDIECVDLEGENEFNEIFDNMETVRSEPQKKKKKIQ